MKRSITLIWLLVGLILCSHCAKDASPENPNDPLQLTTDFNDGKDDWQAGFSEYNGDHEDIYELNERLTQLPAPLDESKQAYLISGMNRSDDLFMYMTRKVEGLVPNTVYRGSFSVTFATSAITDGVGAGGAPGEAVGFGIGLTNVPPVSEPDEKNFYRMNIDKIHQCCTDGQDMIVIGDVANGIDEPVFTLVERSGEFAGSTNEDGELWVIVGTDSGFEGKTELYYSTIDVTFEKK